MYIVRRLKIHTALKALDELISETFERSTNNVYFMNRVEFLYCKNFIDDPNDCKKSNRNTRNNKTVVRFQFAIMKRR